MQRRGLTPLECAAIMAITSLALFVSLPVAYRHLTKAHRQARIIRDWDQSLARAQEEAVQARAYSFPAPSASDHPSTPRTSAR